MSFSSIVILYFVDSQVTFSKCRAVPALNVELISMLTVDYFERWILYSEFIFTLCKILFCMRRIPMGYLDSCTNHYLPRMEIEPEALDSSVRFANQFATEANAKRSVRDTNKQPLVGPRILSCLRSVTHTPAFLSTKMVPSYLYPAHSIPTSFNKIHTQDVCMVQRKLFFY